MIKYHMILMYMIVSNYNTASEVLHDVNWKCSTCNNKTEPSKHLHLWRLPEILIIHLKRFINAKGLFGGIGKKKKITR